MRGEDLTKYLTAKSAENTKKFMSEAKPIWPEMPLMHEGRNRDHAWHVAINQRACQMQDAGEPWPHWMYDAKQAAQEVPRMALVFRREREGKLAKTFQRCACCSEKKHIVENYTTCALGVKCRECPHLLALDKADMSPDERDWIKAWTCAGHILSSGPIHADGFIQTVDDVMYWDSVMESLANTSGGAA